MLSESHSSISHELHKLQVIFYFPFCFLLVYNKRKKGRSLFTVANAFYKETVFAIRIYNFLILLENITRVKYYYEAFTVVGRRRDVDA